MADVATLGLQVDSGPVDKGSRSLDKLSASANKAEGATRRMNGATKAAEASLNGEAAAAHKASTALVAHGRAARSANDNVARMGGSMSGLAAQFQDIGVTAAMGMNPIMIALQQGTQIAGQMEMAVGKGGSALRVLGAAFASLLSPLSIVSIGFTAIAAAALQMVNWASVAGSVLNAMANALPAIANEVAIAGAVLAVAFGPAILRSVLMLSRALLVNMVGALRAVALAALANPFTAIVAGIAAAVTALYVFRDTIKEAIGVDVIGVIKDGTNIIIGSFVGAFEAVEAIWPKLPSVLGDIVYSTANAVIGGIEWMVNKAIEAMKGLLSKLSLLPGPIKEAAGLAGAGLSGIGGISLGRVDNPYSGSVGNAAIDAYGAFQNAQGFDYVSNIGTAIGNAASSGAAKLRELAAAATGAGDAADAAGKKGASGLKETENAADAAGQAVEANRSIFVGFFQDLKGGIAEGKGFWESFKTAGLNAINKIADRLIEFGASNLFNYAFGGFGKSGGGGGLFGSLFSGLGGLFGFARGGVFNAGNVIPFANGGVVSSATGFAMSGGRMGVMGEAGPEAIMPLKRGKDGKLGVASNDNGGTSVVRIELGEGLEGEILKKSASQSIQIVSASAPGIVAQANKTAAAAVNETNFKGGGDYRRA